MHRKTAVIGSESFLARYVVAKLQSSHSVCGYSRSNHSGIPVHVPFDYPSVKLDFPALLDFDNIVYCAGSGIQANKSDDFVFELNTYLPIELANFLKKNGFQGKLVTFGSYAEIGNNSEEKHFTEQEIVASLLSSPNDYGISKRLLTRFFQSARLDFGFYHLILPTIYGPGENPKRLLPYLVHSIARGETPVLTSGNQTRQYVHVRDVADLISLFLDSDAPSGIYNVPCVETMLVKDIVSLVYETMNATRPREEERLKRYDESMKFLALDPTKTRNIFPEWRPRIAINESLQEYNA
ncbi:NAD(P)-dependent oxidoreductase [Dyadobacter sp. 676]|uniref:NAD(P)-dependent oxidoreductase n=1 Tax=Dyadobacter sp. 676 TaxID=3088362 RepID=A0AAU8FPX6_9BACT